MRFLYKTQYIFKIIYLSKKLYFLNFDFFLRLTTLLFYVKSSLEILIFLQTAFFEVFSAVLDLSFKK